jgi:hypothetical protein
LLKIRTLLRLSASLIKHSIRRAFDSLILNSRRSLDSSILSCNHAYSAPNAAMHVSSRSPQPMIKDMADIFLQPIYPIAIALNLPCQPVQHRTASYASLDITPTLFFSFSVSTLSIYAASWHANDERKAMKHTDTASKPNALQSRMLPKSETHHENEDAHVDMQFAKDGCSGPVEFAAKPWLDCKDSTNTYLSLRFTKRELFK